MHILDQPGVNEGDGPIVLIMAPTRELAMQIDEQAKKFGGAMGLSTACLYGGVPRGPQRAMLQRGAHLVIATPGRLIDFLESGVTNLKRCSYLVLDEADRMLVR
jgi:ATP-dependent RNA helicase DDX5/DBP2